MGFAGSRGGAWLVLAAAGGGVPAAQRWNAAAHGAGDGCAALVQENDAGAEMGRTACSSEKTPPQSLPSAIGVSRLSPQSHSVESNGDTHEELESSLTDFTNPLALTDLVTYSRAQKLFSGHEDQPFPDAVTQDEVSQLVQTLKNRSKMISEYRHNGKPEAGPLRDAREEQEALIALIPGSLVGNNFPRDYRHPFHASLWLSLARADSCTRCAALAWARAAKEGDEAPPFRVERTLALLNDLKKKLGVSNAAQSAGFKMCVLLSLLWDASSEQRKQIFAWGDANWPAGEAIPSEFECLLLTEPLKDGGMEKNWESLIDALGAAPLSSSLARSLFQRCIVPRQALNETTAAMPYVPFYHLSDAERRILSAFPARVRGNIKKRSPPYGATSQHPRCRPPATSWDLR